jgi:hypothetical protein
VILSGFVTSSNGEICQNMGVTVLETAIANFVNRAALQGTQFKLSNTPSTHLWPML